LNPTSNYLDQQSTAADAAFDNDTVKAAQNILALLQETQFAAETEVNRTHVMFNIVYHVILSFSLKILLNM
jgi:hypothetical protein